MALQGAEILLYPTAIGSEPNAPDDDTKAPWQRVMVGHAVANAMPVAAANRVGTEGGLTFYGSSFVCDQRGDLEVELGREEEAVGIATFDREALRRYRANSGLFRDRRPDLYGRLTGDEPVD
jgi:N-carbamoylputrescine amidase